MSWPKLRHLGRPTSRIFGAVKCGLMASLDDWWWKTTTVAVAFPLDLKLNQFSARPIIISHSHLFDHDRDSTQLCCPKARQRFKSLPYEVIKLCHLSTWSMDRSPVLPRRRSSLGLGHWNIWNTHHVLANSWWKPPKKIPRYSKIFQDHCLQPFLKSRLPVGVTNYWPTNRWLLTISQNVCTQLRKKWSLPVRPNVVAAGTPPNSGHPRRFLRHSSTRQKNLYRSHDTQRSCSPFVARKKRADKENTCGQRQQMS